MRKLKMDKLKNDIVEEYEKGLKQMDSYWKLNKRFKEDYDYEIVTDIEKAMYLRIECLLENKYQVIIGSYKYSPFNSNEKYKIFDDLDDAIKYFDVIKNKYNGVRRKDAEKMRWDNHNILWKLWRFFHDLLFPDLE